jgi:hypothetical protein
LLDSLKLRAMSMADLAVVQSHPLVLRALALGEGSTSWARQACGGFQQQLTEVLEGGHAGEQQTEGINGSAEAEILGAGAPFLDAAVGNWRGGWVVDNNVPAGHLPIVIRVDHEDGGLGGALGMDLAGLGQGALLRGLRQMLMDPAPAVGGVAL